MHDITNRIVRKKKTGSFFICKCCGNEFYVQKNRFKTAKYCSKKCFNKLSHKGRIGLKLSEEWKNKISKGNTGKIRSQETRDKISKTKKSIGYLREKSGNWKGGRMDNGRYFSLLTEEGKYKLEHRVVMEKHLGRKLMKGEIVHHIDWNGKNNKIENLYVYSSDKEHQLRRKDWQEIIKKLLDSGLVVFINGKYKLV